MPTGAQRNFWTAQGRAIVFLLAATSIICLLLDFYGICPMRTFTLWVFLPSFAALCALAGADRILGNGLLWRGVLLGFFAGFIAAISYDIFRLPFVFAKQLGIDGVIPAMDLFKVFPRFGAMILGEPIEQINYSAAAQIVGWLYHFSNGITFGAMYVAMVGLRSPRSYGWGILMAVGLELGMLFTPYPGYFAIPISMAFVAVTLLAHLIFGAVMGWSVQRSVTMESV